MTWRAISARLYLQGADKWDIYASSHASPALHSGSYLRSASGQFHTPGTSGHAGTPRDSSGAGRGFHSSTSPLNLSRFGHRNYPCVGHLTPL